MRRITLWRTGSAAARNADRAERQFGTTIIVGLGTEGATKWTAHGQAADRWALNHTAATLAWLDTVVLGYLWEQRRQTGLVARTSLVVERPNNKP